MKIAFVLPGSGRSGGVRATVVVAQKLRDRGHDTRILYKRPALTGRNISRYIMKSILFRGNYNWLENFQGNMQSFMDITDCSFYEDEIIVGSGMWSSAQITRLKSARNKKLQYIHGEHIVNELDTKIALNSPIPKIVVASFLEPFVKRYGGTVLDIVPNGVCQNEYFASSKESERDGVGTIYSKNVAKDPETTSSVIKGISKLRPDVPIRIFGPHRKLRGIKTISFTRLPSVEQARDIYSRCLVWIIASKSEGFSIPVLEAMACGCAVVATDCGGPGDMIENGKNGFLVEVGNADQIVERTLLLLDNDKLRKEMCVKAKRTVDRFSWERSIDKLESVLRKLEVSEN